MLQGIDLSNYQADIDLAKIAFDFAIIKASQGLTVAKMCDTHYQNVKRLGKLRGVYHMAEPVSHTAKEEADFFIAHTKGYVGDCIPCLDWELQDTSQVGWALAWLERVEEAWHTKPLIYMNASTVRRYDWSPVVSRGYGLWIAQYRDNQPDHNYDMRSAGNPPSSGQWPFYAIWQWTSHGRLTGYDGNLDLNLFYGDEDAWWRYVRQDTEQIEKPEKQTTYTVQKGDTLSEIGAKLGLSWQEIARRNEILPPYTIYPGQKLLLPSPRKIYTVQKGDTLSQIAKKLGTTVSRLVDLNSLSHPDLIYPGQILIYD